MPRLATKFGPRLLATALLILALGLALGANVANAISLHLAGLGTARIALEDTVALYANSSSGGEVMITEVGASAAGGGPIEELGLPAVAPDGKVLFAAAVRNGRSNSLVWKIFLGEPESAGRRVTPLDVEVSAVQGCVPNLNTDPTPVPDGHGGVIFTGREAGGKDAIFRFSAHRLSCLARAGDPVGKGHVLTLISFGTAQAGTDGEVVFLGWVESEKQALLVVTPRGRISDLAVEGETDPTGTTYRRHTRFEAPFGAACALPSPDGTMVAFTADTSSGRALFLYRGGKLRRVLSVGASGRFGPLTFLSEARPGLMPDGTVALLSAFGRKHRPVLLQVDGDGRIRSLLRHGEPIRSGVTLVDFNNPVLTDTGVIFLAALDSDGREAIYKVARHGPPSRLGSDIIGTSTEFDPPPADHGICTATFAINQRGDFAYLGGR